MVIREDAQRIVDEHRLDDWEKRRFRAVARLHAMQRAIAWPLLGYERSGKPLSNPYWGIGEEKMLAARQLDSISRRRRHVIFKALWPKMARYVDAAWELQKRMPYAMHGQRRAFRAPNRPELTLVRRTHWLNHLLQVTRGFEEEVTWFAQWASFLGDWYNAFGPIFAAAIDLGDSDGDEVYEILAATARGEHEVGVMGRHVVQGLLSSSRPDGWALLENLLIAAQRQEGLRQVILETVDEAHPEAFRRMLQLISREKLARFSSVVRAVDVWLGMQWDAASAAKAQRVIERLSSLIEDEAAAQAALSGNDAQAAYLGLCVMAFADVEQAIMHAGPLLNHPHVEQRFVAASFLAQAHLPESREALLPALHDQDLRVVAVALRGVSAYATTTDDNVPSQLFEQLEEVLDCFPKKMPRFESLVWPWPPPGATRDDVYRLMVFTLGERHINRLLPYIKSMEPALRRHVADMLGERQNQWNEETRGMLLELLGDRSPAVRERAVAAMAKVKLTKTEARQVEDYLRRKPSDLRRGMITLLLGQSDGAALESAGKLLAAADTLRRQAGLELLKQMMEAERSEQACRRLLESYLDRQESLPKTEETLLKDLLQEGEESLTLEDGLGLYDPAERTKPSPPKRQRRFYQGNPFVSKAAQESLRALDDLVHAHRETPVTLPGSPEQEQLLGNLHHAFPILRTHLPVDYMQRLAGAVPLFELWQEWWQERPAELRDDDGYELLRMLAPFYGGSQTMSAINPPHWVQRIAQEMFLQVDDLRLRYPGIVFGVLSWILYHHPPCGAPDFLLDGVEHTLALVKPRQLIAKDRQYGTFDWRTRAPWLGWLTFARLHRRLHGDAWQEAHHARLWRLLRWLDEPADDLPRFRPQLDEVMNAYRVGAASEADILDQLVGPRSTGGRGMWFGGGGFADLLRLSGLNPERRYAEVADDPALQALVSRCRKRIMDIELRRGDMETPASRLALCLRYSGGAGIAISLMQNLGRRALLRGWTHDSRSKKAVFSHLLRVSVPGDEDTPEHFAKLAQQAGLSQKRLLELAMYAPQWAVHVEHTLKWPMFAEAVWWFHAHTKDSNWRVDQEIRELWNAQISERTRLTGAELMEGAVDVQWFHSVYSALGEQRWQKLDKVGKYASGGAGHRRSQLFAAAMAGRLDESELRARIDKKRHQDSVRALGLLPLPEGELRDELLLERYLHIQEFLRGSRKWGSQRRASETRAAEIGLQNLARTAGYSDPLRLQWAMEARSAADLADGPLEARAGDVTVTLRVDEFGDPRVDVDKNGQRLKSIPRRIKKEPQIVALVKRKRELKEQASRARRSLEQTMCRGDVFTVDEVYQLLRHPVLRPMLQQLVFVNGKQLGYPLENGQGLDGLDGHVTALSPDAPLRIAHPHDLLQTDEWHRWQRDCFRRERIQPFKQVFRELYTLTAAEMDDGDFSRRYEGQQVNPRQSMAILASRGWIVDPESGIRRTFHEAGLTSRVATMSGYFTPAEVEGVTLQRVWFTPRGGWKPVALSDVPPRIFSEVMRDLDLVISVAHVGGVNPEATASTVEMRATLVHETSELLKLDNVRLQKQHVLIEGALTSYNVHLGSGTVHQQPGGALCIIPVHSQHRGRVFLPFIDDDPKTAEIISKVLLLARDNEIKDPTILEQIPAR